MKIGVLSDLHIDMNEKKLEIGQKYDRLLADLLYNNEIDLLLLAGDISSDYHDSLKFLDQMAEHDVSKILFVPGNHDFWSIRNGEINTKEIYKAFQDRKESPVSNPFIINDQTAIVGNPGWYDYGFASDKYSTEEFENKKLKVGGWNDRLFVHWNEPDQVVAQQMLDQIENDIQLVGDREIILMTHLVTHPQFVVPLPNRIYDYYNAFLGAKSYNNLYEKYPIKHSIMGHVHFRKTLYENAIHYYCACLGNGKHWHTNDAYTELAYTLETFLIGE